MPRNPADEAIAQQFSEEFATRASQLGASPADLTDDEFHRLANETLRNNLPTLYQQALVASGLAVDASALPEWSAKLAATGATPADAQKFAAGLYPNESPASALLHYQRDIARAAGATVPEPSSKLYDRPF